MGDIIQAGRGFAVTAALKSRLQEWGIEKLQFYPALFRIVDGKVLADWWFMNVYTHLAAWDKELSDYDKLSYQENKNKANFIGADINRYVLNESLLESMPETNRSLFWTSDTIDRELFITKMVADTIREFDCGNVLIFPVSDYETGDEF